jgi:hypothetical protein
MLSLVVAVRISIMCCSCTAAVFFACSVMYIVACDFCKWKGQDINVKLYTTAKRNDIQFQTNTQQLDQTACLTVLPDLRNKKQLGLQ